MQLRRALHLTPYSCGGQPSAEVGRQEAATRSLYTYFAERSMSRAPHCCSTKEHVETGEANSHAYAEKLPGACQTALGLQGRQLFRQGPSLTHACLQMLPACRELLPLSESLPLLYLLGDRLVRAAVTISKACT